MNPDHHLNHWLTQTVDALSDCADIRQLLHRQRPGEPLPSGRALEEFMDLCRSVLFPGYFGPADVGCATAQYHIGVAIERMHKLLTRQVRAGLCFAPLPEGSSEDEADMAARAGGISARLLRGLPHIRRVLSTDVEAAYLGDPAAQDYGEVVCCYPGIRAITNYRVAHELYRLGVPLIPRILTEMAHRDTGIDIHPGAQIGPHFSIDHGTGVVIGATCIIGRGVKLYQGVTLGAKNFPLDDEGHPIKNIPRHPILEDDVVVYSNATVLGRITVGRGAVVGGNLWVTDDVPPGAHLVQSPRKMQPPKST